MNRGACPFSLVEMMVVIAIILVLCTLAAGRIGVMPTAAGLEKTERELELLFTQCVHLAGVRNAPVEVVFAPETRTFAIALETAGDANAEYLLERFKSVALPSGMEVEFLRRNTGEGDIPIRYRCFPDATATGPELLLKFDSRRVRLKLSPLTGQLLRQDNRSRP